MGRVPSSVPGIIGVLGAFFDDSGTHPTSPVVAIGGLLGTEAQWDAFAPRWDALVNEPLPGKPPIKKFGLSKLRGGYEQFRDYGREERDQINARFKQIILDVGLVTLAAAVDRQAWNELITGTLEDEFGKPEEYCFVKCVDSVLSTIRLRKPHEKVHFFFDRQLRHQFQQWADLYLAQSDKYPEIDGISFAPVTDVVALQGADLIATETYQFAQAWLKDRENPRAHPQFQDFIYRDLSGGAILAREHIEGMIAALHERKRTIS
jgi:hypothetical protein